MLCCTVRVAQGLLVLTFWAVKENFSVSKMVWNALSMCPPMF